MSKVDVTGISKTVLLQELYRHAKVQGLGFFQAGVVGCNHTLNDNEAKKLLQQGTSFDYLHGRVMKIDIGPDQVDPWSYDRYNGQGKVQKIVNGIRQNSLITLDKPNPSKPESKLMEIGKACITQDGKLTEEQKQDFSTAAKKLGSLTVSTFKNTP